MRIPWSRGHRRPAGSEPLDAAPAGAPQVVQLDATQLGELSAVFAAPRWLRDLGFASWLLLGVAGLGFSLILLLGVTSVIVAPVIAGFVVATVTMPIVAWLGRRGVPRALGAGLVVLGMIALGILVFLMIVGGIVSQIDEISTHAGAAADRAQGWMKDASVDSSSASSATDSLKTDVSGIVDTFVNGIVGTISALTSIAFAASFTIFSLFFLLKDGPAMRAWVERRMSLPAPVARTITGGVILSLRRYFGGVTIVAAFNGVVVGIGALLLDVPLAGTIAVITFVTAYIPFIGAFVAGAFAVVIALGAEGSQTALIMLVIVLLANGMLQNIVQPIAFGATLKLNPLVVLVVTIGSGSLFGMIGLVLAAPLTSAAVHIASELARARAAPQDPGAAV
jgi:putative heme transporter